MPKKLPAKPATETPRVDFGEILGRFSDARAIIETACRAMEHGDDYAVETSALRSGLIMLDAVYEELDFAIAKSTPTVFNDASP